MKSKKTPSQPIIFYIILILLAAGVIIGFSMKKTAQTKLETVPVRVDDRTELIRLSKEIADGWKIPDLIYEVQVKNQVGNYARVVVTPTNQMLDPLQIIYIKKNGTWEYENMGSAFPELESQIPELFRE